MTPREERISRDTAFSLATLEAVLRNARTAIDLAVDEIRRERGDEGDGEDDADRAGGGGAETDSGRDSRGAEYPDQ